MMRGPKSRATGRPRVSTDDYAPPFDMSLIGEEVPGQFKAQELTAETFSQGGVLNRSADETYMVRVVKHVDFTWASV